MFVFTIVAMYFLSAVLITMGVIYGISDAKYNKEVKAENAKLETMRCI